MAARLAGWAGLNDGYWAMARIRPVRGSMITTEQLSARVRTTCAWQARCASHCRSGWMVRRRLPAWHGGLDLVRGERDRLAVRAGLDLLLAVLAGQQRVVLVLQARPAAQVAAVARGGGEAEQVGGQVAVRVDPGVAGRLADAQQVELGDRVAGRGRHVPGQHHVLVARRRTVDQAEDLLRGQAQRAGQLGRGVRPLAGRHQRRVGEHQVGPGRHGQHRAVAGGDRAADRRDGDHLQALGCGLLLVGGRLKALHLHQPGGEQGQHEGDAQHREVQPPGRVAAAQHRPQAELAAAGRAATGRAGSRRSRAGAWRAAGTWPAAGPGCRRGGRGLAARRRAGRSRGGSARAAVRGAVPARARPGAGQAGPGRVAERPNAARRTGGRGHAPGHGRPGRCPGGPGAAGRRRPRTGGAGRRRRGRGRSRGVPRGAGHSRQAVRGPEDLAGPQVDEVQAGPAAACPARGPGAPASSPTFPPPPSAAVPASAGPGPRCRSAAR